MQRSRVPWWSRETTTWAFKEISSTTAHYPHQLPHRSICNRNMSGSHKDPPAIIPKVAETHLELRRVTTPKYLYPQPIKKALMIAVRSRMQHKLRMPLLRRDSLNSHPCQAKNSRVITIQAPFTKQPLRVMLTRTLVRHLCFKIVRPITDREINSTISQLTPLIPINLIFKIGKGLPLYSNLAIRGRIKVSICLLSLYQQDQTPQLNR